MKRSTNDSAPRTVEEVADSHDLRSVIAAALVARPIDDHSLRRGVWTYVGAERLRGSSPGLVILTLTEIIDAAEIAPMAAREAVTRRVILWCVEAYFGHLGGSEIGRTGEAALDA